MRVLQVVTLVSPDGAFGGPVRVAANLCDALAKRGHDVLLAAGTRGYSADAPADLQTVPQHLFDVVQLPRAGFSGMFSPPMLSWLPRAVRGADVVHVHLARDLVTLPAALVARSLGVPYVLQPHGMVVASANPLAGPLDALLTRRALSSATAVLHLTAAERAGLSSVVPQGLNLVELGNGVPATSGPPLPARPTVLFCARLQARKRPAAFVAMARVLLAEGIDADFVLVGPDEGEGSAVRAAIADSGFGDRIRYDGPLPPSQTLDRMRASSMLVLPSVDEPYPMSVLESLSVGRPAVVTRSCGLAESLLRHGCGLVADETIDDLVAQVRRLLSEAGLLVAMARAAERTAADVFGMDAVVDRLESVYAEATRTTLSRSA